MVETPHSLHTHIRSSLYIYNSAPATVYSGYSHKDADPACYLLSVTRDLRVDLLLGVGGGSLLLLVLMIEAPHSLHTHIRSSLYIYNVIQHLLQWLQVIRMQLQPDICLAHTQWWQ
jgi:hypothetical protein